MRNNLRGLTDIAWILALGHHLWQVLKWEDKQDVMDIQRLGFTNTQVHTRINQPKYFCQIQNVIMKYISTYQWNFLPIWGAIYWTFETFVTLIGKLWWSFDIWCFISFFEVIWQNHSDFLITHQFPKFEDYNVNEVSL